MDVHFTHDVGDVSGSELKRRAVFMHPVTAAEKFQAAVRDCDVDYVRRALSKTGQNGGNDPACFINTKDEWNRTPFALGIRSGNLSKFLQ